MKKTAPLPVSTRRSPKYDLSQRTDTEPNPLLVRLPALAQLAKKHGRDAVADAIRTIDTRGPGRTWALKGTPQRGAPSWPARDVKDLNRLVRKYGRADLIGMVMEVPIHERGRRYHALPLYERMNAAQLHEEARADNEAAGGKLFEMDPDLHLDLLHPELEEALPDPKRWEARRLRLTEIYWTTRADRLVDPDLHPLLWEVLRRRRPEGDARKSSKAQRDAAKKEFADVRQDLLRKYREAKKKRRKQGERELAEYRAALERLRKDRGPAF